MIGAAGRATQATAPLGATCCPASALPRGPARRAQASGVRDEAQQPTARPPSQSRAVPACWEAVHQGLPRQNGDICFASVPGNAVELVGSTTLAGAELKWSRGRRSDAEGLFHRSARSAAGWADSMMAMGAEEECRPLAQLQWAPGGAPPIAPPIAPPGASRCLRVPHRHFRTTFTPQMRLIEVIPLACDATASHSGRVI